VDEVDAGISISIPWTNARKYSAAEREAAANVAAAEHALDGARQAALGMLRTGLTDAETAMHHRDISGTTLLRQARDALKASEIGYEAGKVSLSDWIASATMVRDLESMRRQQETDLQVAIAQLEATVGAPLNTISK
jgi:outer membrane protein TolC